MSTATKKKRKSLIVLIVFAILIVLMGGLFAAVGAYVTAGDWIYPNIVIGDVAVGGLSPREAERLLKELASEKSLMGGSVLVQFPGDVTMEVLADEAGLSATGSQAAEMAYEYGRSGNLLANAVSYLKCRFGSVVLAPEALLAIDEEAVRGIISQGLPAINESLMESAYQVLEDQIRITKGRIGVTLDEDKLFELIKGAFQNGLETVVYEIDPAQTTPSDLQTIYDAVYRAPENAAYDKEAGGVSDHALGVSFDMEKAQTLLDGVSNGEDIFVPLDFTEPEITAQKLEALLFRDRLAAKTTDLTQNSDRNTNIELASKAINGTVLNPGDAFSFNEVVGQRTSEKGYRPAGAYMNGESVTEVGGGICQVSSTIYYTVLAADLEVAARTPHTYTVSYLPLGIDAAVSWGGPEFIFKNNTDYPIQIKAWRSGLTVTIELYGTKTSEYTIQLESVTLSTIAYGTVTKEDGSLTAGETRIQTTGRTGYVAETLKRYYDAGGNLVKTVSLGNSTYSKQDAVVLKGTGTKAENPTPSDASSPPPSTVPPAETPVPATEPPPVTSEGATGGG